MLWEQGFCYTIFQKFKKNDIFPVTSKKMTRFSLTLDQGVKFVLNCLDISIGGEIFVPKIPSYNIIDVVKAINPKSKIKVIGIRQGEKIHEDLITSNDSRNTINLNNMYIILPNNLHKFFKKGKLVRENFSYNSGTNDKFLSVAQLRKLIKSI